MTTCASRATCVAVTHLELLIETTTRLLTALLAALLQRRLAKPTAPALPKAKKRQGRRR